MFNENYLMFETLWVFSESYYYFLNKLRSLFFLQWFFLGQQIIDQVRILISHNGWWEELPDVSQRNVGGVKKGICMRKNWSYEELVGVGQSIVRHDPRKYEIDVQTIATAPGSTCCTLISDDDDVQFLSGGNRVMIFID